MKSKTISTRKPSKRSKVLPEVAEYVIPLGGTGWVVKNSLAKKYTVITDSKREAVQIARSIAKRKGWGIVVFSKDGSIQRQISYEA
jgi:hypothetical protein